MGWLLPGLCLGLALSQVPAVDSCFFQLAPPVRTEPMLTGHRPRAVVLIPGLSHPLAGKSGAKPKLHSYEHADSPLVRRLVLDADVFAFAYAETAPVAGVVSASGLSKYVHSLHAAGYTDIVLVGFSAGGLIARHLVEDEPECGVTKVIQVCTPNAGTLWANVGRDEFVKSLTAKARRSAADALLPPSVQFVCIVGTGWYSGDGVVSIASQWPDDLQKQGVPARLLSVGHLSAPRTTAGIALIAELVHEDQPRWDAGRVATLRRALKRFNK